jgi:hypothetical protein
MSAQRIGRPAGKHKNSGEHCIKQQQHQTEHELYSCGTLTTRSGVFMLVSNPLKMRPSVSCASISCLMDIAALSMPPCALRSTPSNPHCSPTASS